MIRWAVRRPAALLLAHLAAAVAGAAAWASIPIELLPSAKLPGLTVTSWWQSASPETMEGRVTSVLESAVKQVSGVHSVSSVSESRNGRGFATVRVEFSNGTDMNLARLELSERIARAQYELPERASRPQIWTRTPKEFASQTRPLLRVSVSGPVEAEALRDYAERTIAHELRFVEGVGDIDVDGGRQPLVVVDLDPGRTLASGVTAHQVRSQLAEIGYRVNAGNVTGGGTSSSLLVEADGERIRDVEAVTLRSLGNGALRVGSIATVREGYADPTSFYRVDGNPAVSVSVHERDRVNTVDVADRVRERIEVLARGSPPGVRIEIDENQGDTVRSALASAATRAIALVFSMVLVLALLLRSCRRTGLVLLALLLSALGSINLLYVTGLTLNVLTIVGIAVGLGATIGDSVAVLRSVEQRSRAPDADSVARGTSLVFPAVAAWMAAMAGSCALYFAFYPEASSLYLPLAQAMLLSMLAATLVNSSLVPAVAVLPWFVEAPRRPAALVRRLAHHASWKSLRHARHIVAGSIVALLVTAALLRPRAGAVFDAAEGGDRAPGLDVQIKVGRGGSLEQTDLVTRAFESQIRKVPGVKRWTASGRHDQASLHVEIDESHADSPVIRALSERLARLGRSFAGAEVQVLGAEVPKDQVWGSIRYKIDVVGYDYRTLRRIAGEIQNRLQGIGRVRGVVVGSPLATKPDDEETELVLTTHPARLAQYQISPETLAGAVAAALNQAPARSTFRTDTGEVSFTVRSGTGPALDRSGLELLLIPSMAGGAVALRDLADIETRTVPGQVVRDNQQYRLTVSYQFRGPSDVGADLYRSMIDTSPVPPGYAVKPQLGAVPSNGNVKLYVVWVLTLLLAYALAAVLLESFSLPLAVVLAIAVSSVGVLVAFGVSSNPFTPEAFIGVLVVQGMVVKYSLILIRAAAQDSEHRLARSAGALRRAVRAWAPVIFAVVCTMLAGLLPLALLGTGLGANWSGLGYSIAAGACGALLAITLVAPAAYVLVANPRSLWRRKIA
ncbi:MAG TPA: efflux RND transporter permease subunit [Longimicrobium sp.]